MKNTCCFVIYCLLTLQTTHLCSAATPHYGVTLCFQENGNNYEMYSPILQLGTRYNENNNQNEICPSDHKTKAGRRFEHVHVSFSLPIDVPDLKNPSGPLITVTTAKVDAYWDNQYSTKTPPLFVRTSGATYNRNCWGWAFDYDCWIQRPEYIYEDIYDAAVLNPPLAVPARQHVLRVKDAFFGKDTHVEELTSLTVTENMVEGPPGNFFRISRYHRHVTTEKDQEAGVYKQTYPIPGITVGLSGGVYIKKP